MLPTFADNVRSAAWFTNQIVHIVTQAAGRLWIRKINTGTIFMRLSTNITPVNCTPMPCVIFNLFTASNKNMADGNMWCGSGTSKSNSESVKLYNNRYLKKHTTFTKLVSFKSEITNGGSVKNLLAFVSMLRTNKLLHLGGWSLLLT